MSESVRQMVVRLSMDAGGFTKTATTIRGQIRNLDRELKDMGGGASAEKLREKLVLQQQAVENLSGAVSQAKTNFENASTAADKLAKARQYANLESSLEQAKSAAEKTAAELRKLDAMKLTTLGQTLTSFGGSMKRFGRQFSLYVGGPLALLGGKAYKDALNYETAMAKLGVATQTSGEELEALNDEVLTLTETIPMSYTELAALYSTLARAGVPTDQLSEMAQVIAGLGATTDVSAEASAAAMIKFMNVMGIPLDQVENFASSLVALGNAGVSTGSEIFEMAQRMAATGNLAGLSAVEVLSLASSFSSMGINAEAGGSAASKLIKQMQLAAETGDKLGGSFNEAGEPMAGFATVMGLTGDEFKAAWSQDKVGTMLGFFDALGSSSQEGGESVNALLDALDLTEVRLSNLIGTGASNPDFFREMLGLGEQAWEDNTALADGVETAYSTAQAQQDIMLNQLENTSADVGENIVELLQPVLGVVTDLVTEFGKLDEDVQTRWVLAAGAIIALGPVATGIGSVATGVGKIIEHIGKVKAGEATTFTKLMGALAGPAGGWLLAAAGLGAVVLALNSIKSPTEEIIEGLKSIKVELDEETYAKTTAALAELQGQSDALSGKQGEYNKNVSTAVKAGHGTADMFGTALGYEARFTQAEMATISGKYAEEIDRLNGMIGAETDGVRQQALADQRNALQAQWDAEAAQAKAGYMAQVSALVNGMMQSQPEAKAALEQAAKDYDLLAELERVTTAVMNESDAAAIDAMWKDFFTPEVLAEHFEGQSFENIVPATAITTLRESLTGSLSDALSQVGGEDSFAYTLLQTILGDPLTSGLYDPTLTAGALDGLVELLDFKSAGESAGTDFGDALTPGLADAIEGASTPAMEKLGELGDALELEAARQGAAIGTALSNAFNANVKLNIPNLPGVGGSPTGVGVQNNTFNLNPGRGASASDLQRALNDANRRVTRGYGA